MKRIEWVGVLMVVLAGPLIAAQDAAQQPPPNPNDLADYARKSKEQREKATTPGSKPAKVYSNDDVSQSHGTDESQTQGAGAYSFTEDPAFGQEHGSVVRISRDGSKEVFDKIMPLPGRHQELHSYQLYDFQTHKLYTKVLSDPGAPCSVTNYSGPNLGEYDPISGSHALMKELTGGNGQMKQVGTETVNGVAANVMEVTSAQGKSKVWIAQNGGFPVKVVSIGTDGKEQIEIEVKELSFDKPPASTFTPPAGCAAIQGELSTTGVHSEMRFEASSSKATTRAAATRTQPTASFTARAAAARTQPTPQIIAVELQNIPNYTGPCPARIKLVGRISVDGPGTVYYQLGNRPSDLGVPRSVSFSTAGIRTVTRGVTLGPGGYLYQVLASTQGPPTKPGVLSLESNAAGFSVICTNR